MKKKILKKDKTYLILSAIGIILWAGGLTTFLVLILNNVKQNKSVIYTLMALIIIGASLDFITILHYSVQYFKLLVKKSEEDAKKIQEAKKIEEEDVHELVDRLLKK